MGIGPEHDSVAVRSSRVDRLYHVVRNRVVGRVQTDELGGAAQTRGDEILEFNSGDRDVACVVKDDARAPPRVAGDDRLAGTDTEEGQSVVAGR